jgi:crotonobetainyl-CoA:carnitine CoA-transferase CaiB-like acyl-CoA transferase
VIGPDRIAITGIGATEQGEIPGQTANEIALRAAVAAIADAGMVVTAPHRARADFVTLGSAVKSGYSHGDDFQSPPGLGQHSASVLADLGYGSAERTIKQNGSG